LTGPQSQIANAAPKRPPTFQQDNHFRSRRMSHDEKASAPRRFLIDVEETIRVVLEQEDTDGDFQISITDAGPKLMALGTATSNGFKSFDIRVSTPSVFITGLMLNRIRERTCFLTSFKSSHLHAITIASASSSTKPA
jgi:hypothetical protein